MMDIVEIEDDIKLYDTDVMRAKNVLETQLGSLSYAENLGIDLRYFLSEEFQFQNESFKAYLVQRLSESNIDVFGINETVNALYEKYAFGISENQNTTQLVR